MPLQNRVTPLGELIADPAKGCVFGNRGRLHDADGVVRRCFELQRWIACRLEFKGRRRDLMQPGRYTELFFLDDATALAAGHRPCAECRRDDYRRFVSLWPGAPSARELDARLHAERLTHAGAQRHHERPFIELPDGAFVLLDGAPWVVRGDGCLRWTPSGYTEAIERPTGRATVITPASTVDVLAGGWRPGAVPFLHASS